MRTKENCLKNLVAKLPHSLHSIILEDNKLNLLFIEKILQKHNKEIKGVDGLEQAILALKTQLEQKIDAMTNPQFMGWQEQLNILYSEKTRELLN